MGSIARLQLAAFSALFGALACGGAPRGYTISGTVSGPATDPVTVTLSPATGSDRSTKTDSSMKYSFVDVPDGSYTLRATLNGFSFAPGAIPIVIKGVDVSPPAFESHALLQVYGTDMGSQYQNVGVSRLGMGLNDAEVKVNGTVLPYANRADAPALYNGALPVLLFPGDALSLEVSWQTSRVTAIGFVPFAPTLTAPQQGAAFAAAEDIPVRWVSSPDPDNFIVNAQWSCGPSCGAGMRFEVPGSARSYTIRSASVPSRTTLTISVFAYSDGTFAGDYAKFPSYPGMNIRAESFSVDVTH